MGNLESPRDATQPARPFPGPHKWTPTTPAAPLLRASSSGSLSKPSGLQTPDPSETRASPFPPRCPVTPPIFPPPGPRESPGDPGAGRAQALTSRPRQFHRGPTGTSGREALRSQTPGAPLFPRRRRSPGHCGTCSPSRSPGLAAHPRAESACGSWRLRTAERTAQADLGGEAVLARLVLERLRIRPLCRLQPRYLTLQTPTSAGARHSINANKARREAQGSPLASTDVGVRGGQKAA